MKRSRWIIVTLFLAAAVGIGLLFRWLTAETAADSASLSGFPVCISEIMSSNGSYHDELGNAYDWIELYNSSDLTISLSQYKLTDNERKVRYVFPTDAVIAAKGYYVVWCRSNETDERYADFSLSKAGGETVILMNDRSVIVDRVVTLPLEQDAAMARDENGEWQTFDYGTPGYANTAEGYEAYLLAHTESDFPVRLNEVMTSNRSYLDENLLSSDWIELYNDSDAAVDLTGFHLSDRTDSDGYVFPDGSVIGAREYLVIRCDGSAADAYYAPFSLSGSGGETIVFSSGSGVVLDRMTTQTLETDVSLALSDGGDWLASDAPTPGFENSTAGREAYLASVETPDADVRITELMASNLSCIQDAEANFSDWIELTNCGIGTVSLGGYFLSDKSDRPTEWALPDVELEPGERIVVFASGRDCVIDGEPHANFSLNRHSGVVTLCAPDGQIVSSVSYEELDDDVSFYADETTGEWLTTLHATPGYPNDDAGYEAFQSERTTAGALIISEAMTGNAAFLEQRDGEYYDWIEIRNQSQETVDLSGYALTDNLEKTEWCALPQEELEPGEYLVLLCTGETPLTRSDTAQVALSLDAAEDRLYLIDPDGAVADWLALDGIPYGASCGRMIGENGRFYFSSPSPGEENADGYRLIAAQPTTSTPPGIYRDDTELTISLFAEGDIYYTLDGSTPTEESARYTEPITIEGTAVIRASAVSEGKMMSSPVTLNYFLNVEHTLPIIAVTTDEANLDGEDGIRAEKNLFDRTVERAANVAFYSDEGSFCVDCGLKLHGAGTRGKMTKKSYKVVFRTRYGVSPLEFPLFEDDDTTQFYSFLIRNGQDYSRTFLRDELLSKIAYEGTDELFVQDSRFCVFYINGEYQGIYCIKEAFSSGYFATHYGVSRDSVEVQRGYITEGTEFQELIAYAESHDLSCDEYYRYVADRVNLESLIDWSIYEAYAGNRDLSVNVRYYRSTEYDDNRWHYALFDLDYGFDGPATFDYILADAWHGTLLKRLLKNADFRELFLTRMAYQLENYLTEENLMARVAELSEQIESEIPRERARWVIDEGRGWEAHLQKLKRYLAYDRADQLRRSIATAMRIPLSEVESYFTGDGT